MWGKIIIPMYRLWLHGLYGLYGPRCPLSPQKADELNLSLLEFVQQEMTKFTMEQPYMLPILHWQCHACWCSGDFRSHGITRHGIITSNTVAQDLPCHILSHCDLSAIIWQIRNNYTLAINICTIIWLSLNIYTIFFYLWQRLYNHQPKYCDPAGVGCFPGTMLFHPCSW